MQTRQSFREGAHQHSSQINDVTPFQFTNDASDFLSNWKLKFRLEFWAVVSWKNVEIVEERD